MFISQEEKDKAYENLPVIGEYIVKNAEIGWKTGWTNIAYGFGGELTEEERADFERRKEEIEYLKAETDTLYENNKDTLWGIPYVAGMAAQGMANPYEMAANIAVGVATGGLGIVAKIGANVAADAAVMTHQTATLEDRLPTASEYAMGALGSALPDLVVEYGLSKLRFNTDVATVKGNSEVNIRAIKQVSDDQGIASGATARAYQSQNGIVDGVDLFDMKGTNSIINPKDTTFLQRRQQTWADSEAGKSAIIQGKSYVGTQEILNPLEKAVSTNVDELIAYGNYKQGNEGAVKTTLDNIRASYQNDYLNYKNQQILIMDEYSNKLGMTQNEYLEKVGANGKNMAGTYMFGGNSVNGIDEDKFIQTVVKDADILNGGKYNYGIADIANADELVLKYSKYVDENGTIRPEVRADKELMKEFKATEDYNVFKYMNETPSPDAKQAARIEFSINKQDLLNDMYNIFETTAKSTNRAGADVKLTAEGLVQFERINALMASNGKEWTTKTRQQQINTVFDMLRDIQKSVDTNVGTKAYKPFHKLSKHFNSMDDMAMFFQGINEGQYMKPNAQILKDIMEVQSKEIAMLDVYGTTNATRLKNRVESSVNNPKKRKQWFGIDEEADLTTANKAAILQAKEEFEVFFDNVFGGKSKSEMGVGQSLSQNARGLIRRGPMYFSGIQEFITNPATASLRALKYGQSMPQTAGFMAKRQFKRLKKAFSGELPNQPIVAKRLEKKLMQKHYANPQGTKEHIKAALEQMDNFGYKFQELSDYNLSGYGETYATSIINSLGDFAKIDPEVKRVLKTAGVVEDNYDKFLTFARKHLDDNDLYIDTRQLVDMGAEADALRTVFNSISNEVGNVNSNSMFRTRAGGEMEQWWGMFRSFSRNMNADTLKNAAYYTSKDGLRKTRFSVDGFKATATAQNAMNVGTLAAFMYTTGKGAQYVKDWIDGDRDFAERAAIAKTRLEYAFTQGLDDEGATSIMKDIWKVVVEDQLGLNVDSLTNNNPAMSAINRMKQAYKEASQNDSGPLSYEDLNIWGQLVFNQVLSKRAMDTRNAIIDTIQGNWDDSDKVYGMSAEQLQYYYARVYDNRTTVNELRDAVTAIAKDEKFMRAEADYLDDKLDSYNALPDKQKDYFKAIESIAPVEDKEEAKKAFALMITEADTGTTQAEKRDILNEGLQEEFGITSDDVDEYIMTSQIGFDEMSEAKKEYYQRLSKYVGEQDTAANRARFVSLLGNAKADDARRILSIHYELDPNEFDANRGIRPDLNAASSAGPSFNDTTTPTQQDKKETIPPMTTEEKYYTLNLANENQLSNLGLEGVDPNITYTSESQKPSFTPSTRSIPQMELDVNTQNEIVSKEQSRVMSDTLPQPQPQVDNKQAIITRASKDILEQEGTGDKVTSVKTGKGGMTESTKRGLEGRHGRKLTDDEARELYLSEIYDKIQSKNPAIDPKDMETLLGTFYNLGIGAMNYKRFDIYIKNPTEENLRRATLDAPTVNKGLTSKGIAKRKAEDFNKSNPSVKVAYVIQSKNGDITYHDKQGRILFTYKATKGKDKSSSPGRLNVPQ